MKRIGVFCSASEDIPLRYFDIARRVGRWIGETGRTLVYGGSNLGMMECVAASAKSCGGTVVGVIPTCLEVDSRVSTNVDKAIYVHGLSERKDRMIEESDILVALPGGIGTLDEVFHVMANAILGYHHKQVIFYNEDGFYNELLDMFPSLEKNGFARQPLSTYYKIVTTLDELKEITK